MSASRSVRRGLVGIAAALPLALVASASHAGEVCRSVSGRYVERDASGAGCDSPVGLCITGEYRGGDLKGTFFGAATSIVPTPDTGATGVVLFTTDSTITARLGRRSGTLVVKNAGGFRTVGEGSIVDVQTIVGGTGDFAGASGAMRATGVFTQGAGTSTYDGTICLPES